MFDLLAILGRGIQRIDANSPIEDVHSWHLTEDLEVCDERSAHLPVRVPDDDNNPYCMVGGGFLNLQAGVLLARAHQIRTVVCAYGDRSDYLKSINGPSESEVMSEVLGLHLRDVDIVVWPRTRSLPIPSNTGQELKNIFDLALDRELTSIVAVTVGVHVPRTATYVSKHISVHKKYEHLSVTVLESEEVLLRYLGEHQRSRVETLRNSKSFARNWEREAVGISKIVRDVYGDAKPKVETTKT